MPQGATGSHREPQEAIEGDCVTHRDTGKNRGTQGATGSHGETQEATGISWETQGNTGRHRELQKKLQGATRSPTGRHTESYKCPSRGQKIMKI